MSQVGDDNLRDRLSRALPAAMKARDRLAMTALRSALAAIDNAGAVDPTQAASTGSGPGHSGLGAARAAHSEFAGTVAGVGAAEVKRRSLSQAQMEAIVRTEIADRETAATGYERAGQLQHAERLRAEAKVLRSHLNTT